MKTRFLLLTYLLLGMVGIAFADISTERAMSKIIRDQNTYISAECRAASDLEAYDKALADLTKLISSYLEETQEDAPDDVFLKKVASKYQRLDSRTSDNRCRVLLYVKKSDLLSLGNATNPMASTKMEDHDKIVLDNQESNQTAAQKETPYYMKPVEINIDPVLLDLVRAGDQESLVSALTEMRKAGKISAAAAFPISCIDDFYIAILSGNKLAGIMHVKSGRWINAITGKDADPHDFPNSTAYWFTITK